MTPNGTSVSDEVLERVRGVSRGVPLPQAFYVSSAVFAADLERIFGRQWLYVGPSCIVPKQGDYLTWRVGNYAVIVVRGADGKVRAFHNTCRHRGSRVCREELGRAKRFVCPYHRWTYDLDGRLLTRTGSEFDLAETELGLLPVALHDVAGLLFVSFAEHPPDFSAAAEDIARRLERHGLNHAKVAKRITYKVAANWKLILENNSECYHCGPNHPEIVKATLDVIRDDPRHAADVQRRVVEANAHFRQLGLDEGDAQSSMTGAFWRARRTPLMAGWLTQSLDGQPVAPLMGALTDPDCGTLRLNLYPNCWQHASSDHAVATRVTPVAPDECTVDVFWLVHRDAVEGTDYTLERLVPFWQRISEQDWFICEENQIGVSSSGYRPVGYAKRLEANLVAFVDWYLEKLVGRGPVA